MFNSVLLWFLSRVIWYAYIYKNIHLLKTHFYLRSPSIIEIMRSPSIIEIIWQVPICVFVPTVINDLIVCLSSDWLDPLFMVLYSMTFKHELLVLFYYSNYVEECLFRSMPVLRYDLHRFISTCWRPHTVQFFHFVSHHGIEIHVFTDETKFMFGWG